MAVNNAYRWAKRIAVTVVGFTVLLAGIAMIVLPGPAFVVIPVGLGILGLEFAWARSWLRRIKEKGEALARSARGAMGNHGASDSKAPDSSADAGGSDADRRS